MDQSRRSFPKRARLTRRSEFLQLSREGNREGNKVQTLSFVVISKINDKKESRIGITVSTKVGKAVVRNRVKRLVREFFRQHRHQIPGNRDYLVVAKKGAGGLNFDQVAGELKPALFGKGSLPKRRSIAS